MRVVWQAKHRSKLIGIGLFIEMCGSCVDIVVVFPEKIGVANVMFLYTAMSFILLVFVILCVPDTKGRTLEEISKELAKK